MYIEKFEILLDAYYKKAQILNPGESTLSFNEIKQQASFYKTKIQDAEKHPWPGWKEPGQKALQVLDIILSGGQVDNDLKGWAKLDVSTNFKNIFTDAEMKQFNKILDSYNAYVSHYSS